MRSIRKILIPPKHYDDLENDLEVELEAAVLLLELPAQFEQTYLSRTTVLSVACSLDFPF